jgi:hypothetical protein
MTLLMWNVHGLSYWTFFGEKLEVAIVRSREAGGVSLIRVGVQVNLGVGGRRG